jgi:hypothetical protein
MDSESRRFVVSLILTITSIGDVASSHIDSGGGPPVCDIKILCTGSCYRSEQFFGISRNLDKACSMHVFIIFKCSIVVMLYSVCSD